MASSSSSSLLFLLLLPLVAAQTYHWGSCPTPMLQPNFTLQQYMGHWYEIEKLPASFEKGKCIEADYAVRPDGTIQVLNKLLYKGKVTTAEGTAVVIDPREPARLGISFSHFSPYVPYLVLSTDYSGLSAVYSCTNVLNIFYIDYAWILSRSRFPPPESVASAKQLLSGEGVEVCGMKPTDQMGCPDV